MNTNINDFNESWNKHKNPYAPWGPNIHEKKWQPEKPKSITINDLFPSLDRWSIGWSPVLETLRQLSNVKATYPPYDIIDEKKDTTLINVAVAGFTKKDITVTVEEKVLKIEGIKEDKGTKGEVVHNGIAGRDFKLSFALAEFYEVESAKIADGILSIKLVKNVPDEKKPKVIEID